MAPTDALLAMCSSAAYGVKEGLGEHSQKLPAEVELDRLGKKLGVSTGDTHGKPNSAHLRPPYSLVA